MDDLMNRIADIVPRLQGWCTVEKAQWLARRIVEQKYLDIVEIGVFGGRSLIPMAMAMHHLGCIQKNWLGQVTGVDPYDNAVAEAGDSDVVNKGWWEAIDLKTIYKGAQEAVISHRLGYIVRFLLCTSSDAVEKFQDLSLDMVHVDGSHNEAASTHDVKIWWPKLKPGGIMVMDDVNWIQVKAARDLAASFGKMIHQMPAWEVFQKDETPISPPEKLPAGCR